VPGEGEPGANLAPAEPQGVRAVFKSNRWADGCYPFMARRFVDTLTQAQWLNRRVIVEQDCPVRSVCQCHLHAYIHGSRKAHVGWKINK
jgi:hypothetical protein